MSLYNDLILVKSQVPKDGEKDFNKLVNYFSSNPDRELLNKLRKELKDLPAGLAKVKLRRQIDELWIKILDKESKQRYLDGIAKYSK